MKTSSLRVLAMGILAAAVALAGAPRAESGFAATATLRGRVTDSTGAPVAGARVTLQVVASLESAAVSANAADPGIAYWGQRRVVSTNSDGRYQAVIGVPDAIPEKHLFAEVTVAKLSGPPFYIPERRSVGLAGSGTARALEGDVVLRYGALYGAIIRGVVKDRETGRRLRRARVSVNLLSGNPFFYADGDGEYSGVFWMGGPTLGPTPQVPQIPGVSARGGASGGMDGLDYEGASRPDQPAFVADEYRRLTQALSAVPPSQVGKLQFAFAVNIEPYTKAWWTGDMAPYSDLLERTLLPVLRDYAQRNPGRLSGELLTRFEPFWWENGHVTESGKTIRNLRDSGSDVVAGMTYRNTAQGIVEVSSAIRRRVGQRPGMRFLLGAETKPAGPGIPPHITSHNQWGRISGELISALGGLLDRDDGAAPRGIFIHSGKSEADAVLDSLLGTPAAG